MVENMPMGWHGLKPGDTINNDQLCNTFQCSSQGGMRRSLKKNSLVIVSNHVESLYDDRWVGNVLHYTGMGRIGDQSHTYMQNKTLYESTSNGVEVHLFEVFKAKEYTYRGQVELVDSPYQEVQPDDEGSMRKVWIFPVKLTDDGKVYQPSDDLINAVNEVKEKKARKMNMEDLRKRAKSARKVSSRREGIITAYERDTYIAEYVKRCARGVCQLCEDSAPFQNKLGEPYLETHHIVWLARGGEDSIDNTVALCPNCHKKMHILDLSGDVIKLKNVAKERYMI